MVCPIAVYGNDAVVQVLCNDKRCRIRFANDVFAVGVNVAHEEGVRACLCGCVGDDNVLCGVARYDYAFQVHEVVVVVFPQAEPDVSVVGIVSVVGDVEGDVDGGVGLDSRFAQCYAVENKVVLVGIDVSDGAACCRLLYADDCILSVVETVGRCAAADALLVGVECREDEVVVAHAAPSPVDVEEVGVLLELIAVAYELVSAAR